MSQQTKYSSRTIPRISMADFPNRIDEITAHLVAAAETDGFFVLIDHEIPVVEIERQFEAAERFFALPDSTKAKVPFNPLNYGYEANAQIRPSTGRPDRKESYQMQFSPSLPNLWLPEPLLPGFKSQSLSFMHLCHSLSQKLMLCFARGLGFPDDYFVKAHDLTKGYPLSVLRALHYFAVDGRVGAGEGYYRAGEHADWDFVTLLFQREGQSGLEICPGREVFTEYGRGDEWTKVEPVLGEIVCNIGDMLMSWSDDRFKSTFHRVKTPVDPDVDYFGPRYSLAFFNQPNADCRIQGPLKKYPVVTGAQFIEMAMKRNYEALQKTVAAA